jgi:hypothetical protein
VAKITGLFQLWSFAGRKLEAARRSLDYVQGIYQNTSRFSRRISHDGNHIHFTRTLCRSEDHAKSRSAPLSMLLSMMIMTIKLYRRGSLLRRLSHFDLTTVGFTIRWASSPTPSATTALLCALTWSYYLSPLHRLYAEFNVETGSDVMYYALRCGCCADNLEEQMHWLGSQSFTSSFDTLQR